MKKIQKKKIKFLALLYLSTFLSLTGCQKANQTSKVGVEVEINNSGKELSETENTLNIYNECLKKMGSREVLTQKDLENIIMNINLNTFAIKLNDGEYSQVGYDDYNIVKMNDGGIRLYLDSPFINIQYDLFTKKECSFEEMYTTLETIGECIQNNAIDPIGIRPQKNPGWTDEEKEFIRETYGEDVLDCFKQEGFPLSCYDVNDFYNAYLYKNENKKK